MMIAGQTRMGAHAEGGVCKVRELGATGGGETLDTRALQDAIDSCHQVGGGTVVVTDLMVANRRDG